MKEKTLAVLFGGIGGFSVGAMKAKIEYGGEVYKYNLLCSIDYDPVACQNHDLITGEKKAVIMDLFSRHQYKRYWGHEPGEGWHEVTPWEVWQAFGCRVPDMVFLSPPCKGLSGLLPEEAAQSEKYQALNELTVRGIELVLEACYTYGGKVPKIIHFENVPRITSRGKFLLAQIRKLLKEYRYAVDMNPSHNLGEIGGLGQNRVRFLIMARQQSEIPNFIYQPPKKSLKTIGDIIGPLPYPGDIESAGWMHRIPKLQWKTWVRLALIPAGGDWRDLQRDCYANVYQVVPFDEPSPTVTGAHRPNNGAISLADPRIGYEPRGGGSYGVQNWGEPANTVTGQARINGSNGCAAVSDPRIGHKARDGSFRVQEWDKPSISITGSTKTGGSNGISGIADPRLENVQGYGNKYRITRFGESAPTVTGSRIGSGAIMVSDPRTGGGYTNKRKVLEWDKPATTVTGTADIQSGAQSVSDPRLNCSPRSGSYKVQKWEEPAGTVTSADIHAGAAAVSDPRIPQETESGIWLIIAEDGTWHRPVTTYEMAMIQSFPRILPDGRPFQLVGCADAKAREYIGNAYPPDSGEASCIQTLLALAKADAKIGFELSNEIIWVNPVNESENGYARCNNS